jgi:tRNA(fMet)-specific endonuclease VapC
VIHLDTNAVIAVLGKRPPAVRARMDAALAAGSPIGLSAIVYHELMYGAAHSRRQRENEEGIALLISSCRLAVLPFDEADARAAAEIRAHLRREATPIGPYDLLIAAQARRAGATLVTANGREFVRVPGLVVTDWAV